MSDLPNLGMLDMLAIGIYFAILLWIGLRVMRQASRPRVKARNILTAIVPVMMLSMAFSIG